MSPREGHTATPAGASRQSSISSNHKKISDKQNEERSISKGRGGGTVFFKMSMS